MSNIKELKEIISTARGDTSADVVISGRIFNVYTGNIKHGYISIKNGRIACITDEKISSEKYFDFEKKIILPGFIDSHIHIESSMLVPSVFSKTVIPHGTTSVVADPHEIANVFGKKGVEFMINDGRRSPMNFYYMIPSCVPSSNFETTGGFISSDDIVSLKNCDEVIGLAEFMAFPSIVEGDENSLYKILSAKNMVIDGHAPSLRGKDLCAYIAAGVESDHECTKIDEAREKLEKGMYIMIREGTAAKNLDDLVELVDEKNSRRCILVTDDISVGDLLEYGHVDRLLRKAVERGLTSLQAVRMVTLNPAEYFRKDNIGAISPGKKADLAVVDNLKNFNVSHTFVKGQLVAKNGKTTNVFKGVDMSELKKSVNIKDFNEEKLKIECKKSCKIQVIEAFDHSLYTEKFEHAMKPDDGFLQPDVDNDILKICVVERHKNTGNVSVGFVKGFGFKKGAIGSTIAHDAHNIVCIGSNDRDIALAVNRLEKINGGVVFVKNQKIIDELALPVAGLMTDEKPKLVREKLENIRKKIKYEGCLLEAPIETMSFLALPVIPRLKITDRGLFDVDKFEPVELISR
ncbi:MAG: adenine deaminase [Candidatus Thermoplasmatota archaeon]